MRAEREPAPGLLPLEETAAVERLADFVRRIPYLPGEVDEGYIGLLSKALYEDIVSLIEPRPAPCLHRGIQAALNLMEAEPSRSLGIDELARTACLGRSQFIAAFKREIGCTPHHWLRKLRIEAAKRLLETGLDVTETGLSVGFASLSGFEQAFHELVGMLPKDYRRGKQK